MGDILAVRRSEYQPPLLAVWGKNDPFFLAAGAEAFKRDIPKAQVKFYDTGHFALETHCREIAEAIVPFLENLSQFTGMLAAA